METDNTPQAQAKSTSQESISGPSDRRKTHAEVVESILADTPANREAEAAKKRRDVVNERIERIRIWREFIGDRKEQGILDTWVFSGEAQERARQEIVLAGVREYVDGIEQRASEGAGALFYGPCGTGKDFLATAIIREATLERGQSAKYLYGVQWFQELRGTFDDDARRSEGDVLSENITPTWLVVSDPLPPIGSLKDYQAQMLLHLIDARKSRGKPTIVTVNVQDGDEGGARMGFPTWSRIKGGAWVFACNWGDYRKPVRVF